MPLIFEEERDVELTAHSGNSVFANIDAWWHMASSTVVVRLTCSGGTKSAHSSYFETRTWEKKPPADAKRIADTTTKAAAIRFAVAQADEWFALCATATLRQKPEAK